MTIPTDRRNVAAALATHGISLSEAALDALCARLVGDAQLIRQLMEDSRGEGIGPATRPALIPAWGHGVPTDARKATAWRDIDLPSPGTPAAPAPFSRSHATPTEAVETALAHIESRPNGHVFTAVFAERARAEARALE